MRIPLDYYRILGIPFQVSAEQIDLAHADRGRQLPRQEYSQIAIVARQHLLDEAYQVLSAAERRRDYDAQFFDPNPLLLNPESSAENLDSQTGEVAATAAEYPTPQITIAPADLVGALLILQELGEYELVIRLAETYLDLEPTTRPDMILTLALAYGELSREYWQDKNYEQAASTAAKALTWLEQEQMFPQVASEIRHDCDRLRPYRVLELLSQEKKPSLARQRGLNLLEEMLAARGGIDGQGDDRSGLGVDNFLRFIQQLRVYLTQAEQEKIWAKEAQRPSAVGNYLLVYALIARGFAQKQPAAIVAASQRLQQLQKHQDVSIERSICALLLGQTEQASTILEKSQQPEILNYIKEQSGQSPDLLPGLCRYGERWLQTEVFCHFRDLVDRKASLKEYFAEEEVQNYLEELSGFPDEKVPVSVPEKVGEPLESEVNVLKTHTPPTHLNPVPGATPMRESAYSSHSRPPKPSLARANGERTGTAVPALRVTAQEETFTPYTQGSVVVTAADHQPALNPPRRRPRRSRTPAAGNSQQAAPETVKTALVAPKRRRPARRKLRLDRVAILGVGLVGTLAVLSLGVKAIVDSQSPLAALQGEQLPISLNTPILEIPSANAEVMERTPLGKETAKETIQAWLAAKSAAFGSEHQKEPLKEVLTGSALEIWQKRAAALQGNNYWRYDHQVDVRSVTNNAKNPNLATVEAIVNEKAMYFHNGKEIVNRSYNESLKVRYDLVRQGDKWLIEKTQVLP
ncbi:heat shock protein DnaJ-like [Microcystis aeruginosa NIES-3804]|uniref:Heat shock protein DnaJ-like n=1 Tax=Microcystis aeruginosa NIES-3804 TaxID=2517783 RepID=A0A6H9G3K8_MICAE|nr:IMS domain-containing protein [Microcystis aeruginosa]GCL49811.1 heat shock protein DnaJ-like [Microcystis aeruginosa NIES-3804]